MQLNIVLMLMVNLRMLQKYGSCGIASWKALLLCVVSLFFTSFA